MRAGNSILDADMATMAHWVRTGFAWWRDELSALLPQRMRRTKPLVNFISYKGVTDWERIGKRTPVAVLIDPALCLMRTMPMPPLNDADLKRLIALDADRIFPLPATELIVSGSAIPGDRTQVRLVGYPRSHAVDMIATLREAGEAITRVGVANEEGKGSIAADLTEAFADAGLIRRPGRAAAQWWLLTGLFFGLNLGLLIWRDMQTVSAMEGFVTQQGPAVTTARAIAARIERTRDLGVQLAGKRAAGDPLLILGAVTEALPERGAWVQRIDWSDGELRVSGYRSKGVDAAAALRRSPIFEDVRPAGVEAGAQLPTGQPFDLVIRLRTNR